MYNKLFFNVSTSIPPYELIIVGEFPNARYFSIGLYDNHSAITQNLSDVEVVPLTSTYTNPFQPGVAFVNGQKYAVPIKLGGSPGTQEPGCMMTGFNVDVNAMDGTQRHPYMNWNLDPGFFKANPGVPDHEVDTPTHSDPNPAGVIIIRNYLSLTKFTSATLPHVIVRDLASGCAYPASMVNTMGIVTTGSSTGNAWLNQKQVQNHNLFANWQPTDCWGIIPTSKIQWIRGDEYTPGANPDASYLFAYTPAGLPQTLASAGEVMRLRFQVPTTPPTPCTNGCSRSGGEQMRYLSVSFQVSGGGTLASLPDSCPVNSLAPCTPLVQDANGFVTLIVGTGVTQPSWVTAANGYTWVDLTKSTTANYTGLNEVAIRDILPASGFSCGGELVPYKDGQATTAGAGLMGLYAPVIDYPVSTSLPQTASELSGTNTCAIYPSGPPQVSPTCGVAPAKVPTIGAMTTQCAAPGCTEVVVQPQPPLSILSLNGMGGFGTFPLGLPYTGNSDFIQITDNTQSWSAGHTGDACTVQIGEWSDTAISLVANVNQNGVCPMAAGDSLTVTVWNPQNTQSAASLTVTVQP
ncbi:MAG TPA: hypothetical protein VKR61_10880 [Bryobacteraceae bacterium]|nr:hypothetical protein [Bryobacteraceae bacterium]